MKKNILVLMFVLITVVCVGKEKVVVYCNSDFYPFSYTEEETGDLKGLYVDVVNTAFSRMKSFDVVIEAVPWKRGKYYMEKGTGFALVGAFYHGHDWDYIYPYSLDFYTQTQTIVFMKNKMKKTTMKIPDDYYGLRGGNMAGSDGWVPAKMRKSIDEGKIKYEEVQNVEMNIRKLIKGRLDFIFCEKLLFEYTLRKLVEEGLENKKLEDFSYQGIVSKDPVYLGYSKYNNPEYQLKFQQEFDNEIFKMTKDDEINKIFLNFKE